MCRPPCWRFCCKRFADLRQAGAAEANDDARLESSLSTAEQIGVLEDAVLHGQFFGQTALSPGGLAQSLVGTLVRRIPEDVSILNKFWHAVVDKHAKSARWRLEGVSSRWQPRLGNDEITSGLGCDANDH